MNDTRIAFNLIEHIGVIGENRDGWKKEVNIVSWNNKAPKIDVRDWDENHERMGRGITLTEEQAEALYKALKGRYEK